MVFDVDASLDLMLDGFFNYSHKWGSFIEHLQETLGIPERAAAVAEELRGKLLKAIVLHDIPYVPSSFVCYTRINRGYVVAFTSRDHLEQEETVEDQFHLDRTADDGDWIPPRDRR